MKVKVELVTKGFFVVDVKSFKDYCMQVVKEGGVVWTDNKNKMEFYPITNIKALSIDNDA